MENLIDLFTVYPSELGVRGVRLSAIMSWFLHLTYFIRKIRQIYHEIISYQMSPNLNIQYRTKNMIRVKNCIE